MIPLVRGEEPDALRRARWWRLARARYAATHGLPVEFVGYNVAGVLWERQDGKCAYCEASLRSASNQPTEHFRPKSPYWWLAWSWENLSLSCTICNDAAHKGAKFPLAAGATPLAPMSYDVDSEQALLLDPYRDDPQAHIEYKKVGARWLPLPRAGSPRGAKTIEIFKLDEAPGTLDHYSAHVANILMPEIKALQDALRGAGQPRGEVEFKQACSTIDKNLWWPLVYRHIVQPRAALRALSWHVIDHHFPATTRRAYRLAALPALRSAWQPGPPPAPDAQDGALDEEAWWAVRAVGPPQSADYEVWMLRALRAVCATPRTMLELAAIFDLSEQVMRDHADQAIRAGALVEQAGALTSAPA